jgi:hypothetical protein
MSQLTVPTGPLAAGVCSVTDTGGIPVALADEALAFVPVVPVPPDDELPPPHPATKIPAAWSPIGAQRRALNTRAIRPRSAPPRGALLVIRRSLRAT